jgi:hypothetical protein
MRGSEQRLAVTACRSLVHVLDWLALEVLSETPHDVKARDA